MPTPLPIKKVIVIVSVLGILIIAGFALYRFLPKAQFAGITQRSTISPDILYITNPATSFSGKIEKIDGNTLTVSQDMMLAQLFAPPAAGAPNQPPTTPVPQQSKKITYKVLVTDKTFINQSPSSIPYLFKTVTPATAATPIAAITKLTLQDLKTGQSVNINTTTDLRTLSGNQFEAVGISISNQISIINGTITNISGNDLTISAFSSSTLGSVIAANAEPPKAKTYTVTVNQNTEISRYGIPTSPNEISKPEKYSLSDLKKDLPVTVYTDADVTTTSKFTGLKIEPMFPQALPAGLTPPVIATSPATKAP